MFSQPPCKDCSKRQPDCHSVCPEYKEFRKEREAVYKKRATAQTVVPIYNIPKKK